MTTETDRFFVLTGGPGSGKSTLIDALAAAGHACSGEAGRGIIRDQVAIGGAALPWDDRRMFAETMLCWDMRSHREARARRGTVFFDRGVPDVMGYLRLVGEAVPAHVTRATELFRYNATVFVAPPWPAIFTQDSERRQDFDEAVRTYEVLAATYRDCGYSLVELPRADVAQRAAFVLAAIGAGSAAAKE
jgi:predicted ATPase